MNIPNLRNRSLPWKIFTAALVIAIIFLLTCNRKKRDVPPPPKVTSVKDLKKDLGKAEAEINRVRDSAAAEIKKLDRALVISDNKLVEFIRTYGTQETDIDEELRREVPDTCRELQIRLTDRFNALKRTSAKKDAEFVTKISTVERVRRILERRVQADSLFQTQQKKIIDTCLSNQSRLQAYADKVKPKRSIYAGITGIGSAVKPYEGIGINLGLENKRGTKFEVGVLQIAGKYHYTAGYKKTIFKF